MKGRQALLKRSHLRLPCFGSATFAVTSDPGLVLAPKPLWVSTLLFLLLYTYLLLRVKLGWWSSRAMRNFYHHNWNGFLGKRRFCRFYFFAYIIFFTKGPIQFYPPLCLKWLSYIWWRIMWRSIVVDVFSYWSFREIFHLFSVDLIHTSFGKVLDIIFFTVVRCLQHFYSFCFLLDVLSFLSSDLQAKLLLVLHRAWNKENFAGYFQGEATKECWIWHNSEFL